MGVAVPMLLAMLEILELAWERLWSPQVPTVTGLSFAIMFLADELAFGLENLRVPREEIHQRIRDALKMVGLDCMATRPTAALSGGQKQRIVIAAARCIQKAGSIPSIRPSCAGNGGALFQAGLARETARRG